MQNVGSGVLTNFATVRKKKNVTDKLITVFKRLSPRERVI
jgi:hypothetical protein